MTKGIDNEDNGSSVFIMQTLLNNALEEISKTYESEVPDPIKENHYEFTFDDYLSLEIFSIDEERIAFMTPFEFSKNKTQDLADQLRNVLQWSTACLKSKEEVLSWDPDRDRLIAYRAIKEEDLKEKKIIDYLESFLNYIEFWQNILGGNTPPPPSSSSPFTAFLS